MKRISIFVLLCVLVFAASAVAGADAENELSGTSGTSGTITLEAGETYKISSAKTFNTNTTITGTGTISIDTSVEKAITVTGGKLVINGATIEQTETPSDSSGNDSLALVIIDGENASMEMSGGLLKSGFATALQADKKANITLNGGTIESHTDDTHPHAAIVAFNDATITLNGCTVTTESETSAINASTGGGKVEINEGTTVTSKNGLAVQSGNTGYVIIKGGTFSTSTYAYSIGNNSGDRISPWAKKNNSTPTAGKIEITGGAFYSDDISVFVSDEDDKGNRLVTVKSGDWYIVKSTDLTSEPKIDTATGELSYDIKAEGTATLADVLETLDETQLASIKKIEITPQITEVSNATLKLVKLDSLDLSNATNLTEKTLDLDGVSIDTVVMSKDTAITKVALTTYSEVKTINAAGTAALVSIDLASNKNIETVNVSETSVDVVNASGCTNLKTLNTKGAKVTVLNVTGCEKLADLDCSAAENGQGEITSLDLTTCVALEQLDVSANRLLVLDLSKNTKLTGEKAKLGGQKSAEKFKRSLEFDLLSFILKLLGLITDDKGYAANITSVYAVDENGTETKASGFENGKAMFDASPYSIKYLFDTKFSASATPGALLAADSEFEMDVTLEGTGTAEEKEPENEPENEEKTSVSGSGGGCELGLGLWSLAALIAFAKFSKKA